MATNKKSCFIPVDPDNLSDNSEIKIPKKYLRAKAHNVIEESSQSEDFRHLQNDGNGQQNTYQLMDVLKGLKSEISHLNNKRSLQKSRGYSECQCCTCVCSTECEPDPCQQNCDDIDVDETVKEYVDCKINEVCCKIDKVQEQLDFLMCVVYNVKC